MIETHIIASRKQPEKNNHIEIIIKANSDNDARVLEEEMKKAAHGLSRKVKRKLSYEMIRITRNSF